MRSIFYFILITLLQLTNSFAWDLRENPEYIAKERDLLVIGQPIFDVMYNFEDIEQLQKCIRKLGIQRKSHQLVAQDVITQIAAEKQPISSAAGGTGSNTAAGVAFMGSKVTFLGVIGDDEFGRQYVKEMESYNMHNIVRIDQSGMTGVSAVLIAHDPNMGHSERYMLTSLGVSAKVESSDLSEELIGKHKVMLLEGYMWERAKEVLIGALQTAKKQNVLRAFTFGDKSVVSRNRSEFLTLIKELDIVFADQQQIFTLYQTNDWPKIRQQLQKNNNITVVTFGKNGAYIVTPQEQIHIPANKLENIVDATGAGDQFAAGFLYSFIKGYDLEKCGYIGAESAAQIIQQIGAKPNIKSEK